MNSKILLIEKITLITVFVFLFSSLFFPLSEAIAQEWETVHYPNKYFTKTFGPNGSTSTKHIYDDRGGLIATIEANGEATSTYYIHTDHLGGTNVVTDEEGEVVEVTDYLPFGEINTNQAPTGVKTDRKYTSHTYDEESDLNYMNARYQDGEIGRFLSQDPAFQVVGSPELKYKTGLNLEQYLSNPQHLNSYSYVANNPIKYQDPTGEFLETGIDLVSLSLSLNDFQQNPSLGNAAFVGLDALGLAVPGIPAVAGLIRHGDDVVKGAKVVGNSGDNISYLSKFDPSNPSLSKLGEARSVMLEGVQNEKLQRIINQNYREFSGVGNGSSIEGLLREAITGKPVGRGGFHTTKIENDMRGLRDVLKTDLSRNDRAKAHYMLKYMKESRKFFRKTRNQ